MAGVAHRSQHHRERVVSGATAHDDNGKAFDLTRGRIPLIAAILAGVSLFFNLYQVPRTGFNPDESRWINRAHYLSDIVDPGSPTWEDQYLTRGQPPVGSYVTGLGLLLQGRDLMTNGSWDFAYDAATNAELGNMPTYDDLLTARRTSAALMAATVAVVFLIGRRLTSLTGAVAGALVLAIHPFSSYIGSLATSDALFGLLIALATLAAIRLGEWPTWGRAVTLGVLLGLGGATKLSPLFVAVPLALVGVALLRFGQQDRPNRAFAWHLVSLPVTALATFVAVYPYLWPDPVRRTLNLFRFRVEEMATQSSDWPVMAVPTRAEALFRVGENFELRFSIAGRLEATLGDLLGISFTLPRIELALAVAGTIVLIALAIKQEFRGPAMLTILALGGQVGVTVAGMRSEFDRYHVPMAIAAAICVGVLVGVTVPAVQRWARSASQGRAARQVTRVPAPSYARTNLTTTEQRRSASMGRRQRAEESYVGAHPE